MLGLVDRLQPAGGSREPAAARSRVPVVCAAPAGWIVVCHWGNVSIGSGTGCGFEAAGLELTGLPV